MAKPKLSLQPSEAVVVQAAATIYAAYLSSGRVTDGQEKSWIERSLHEAIHLARLADDEIQSDTEMG